MKIIKWETLKLKCQQAMNMDPSCMFIGEFSKAYWSTVIGMSLSEKKNWRVIEPELREKCYEVISNWDIRRAKALIDLFPDILPRMYRAIVPLADQDAQGNWVLTFA